MTHDRRDAILELLETERMVKTQDLIDRFGVSNETIRRDLEALEKAGYLNRVYGGAVARVMNGMEPEYSNREVKNYKEKLLIAEKAVEFIEDGDTLIIDLGTTTLQFAKALRGNRRVTVVTNALPVAMELVNDPAIRVILLGGNLRSGELTTSGFLGEEGIGHFNVDKLILGIGGLTAEKGVTDYNIEEANLRRHFVKNCSKVIGLADHSKIGVTAMNNICKVNQLSMLITDAQSDKMTLAGLRAQGVKVIVAED